jgi:hypothetical protein
MGDPNQSVCLYFHTTSDGFHDKVLLFVLSAARLRRNRGAHFGEYHTLSYDSYSKLKDSRECAPGAQSDGGGLAADPHGDADPLDGRRQLAGKRLQRDREQPQSGGRRVVDVLRVLDKLVRPLALRLLPGTVQIVSGGSCLRIFAVQDRAHVPLRALLLVVHLDADGRLAAGNPVRQGERERPRGPDPVL